MGKKREKQLGEGGDEDGKKEKKAGKKKKKQNKKKNFLDRSETDSALNLVMVATGQGISVGLQHQGFYEDPLSNGLIERKCNKFFPPLPLLKILKYCQKFGRKEVDENHFSD